MSEEVQRSPVSVRALGTAAGFGVVALLIVLAGLTIPIPGTGVVTDPRELFTTIGGGLSGPVGGIIIGILAGVAEPGGIALASMLAHTMGGLWMGFSYKKLIYERIKMPGRLVGWALLIIVYYVIVLAGFVGGMSIFHSDVYTEFFGDLGLFQAYIELFKGVLWEVSLTTIVTTLVMAALPERFRVPVW